MAHYHTTVLDVWEKGMGGREWERDRNVEGGGCTLVNVFQTCMPTQDSNIVMPATFRGNLCMSLLKNGMGGN